MSLFKSKTAKFFVGFVALAMVVTFVAAPSDAKAATAAELQAQIDALMAQISSLQGTSTSGSVPGGFQFTSDLTVGSTGSSVMYLQQWLNANGYTVAVSGAGSPGMETSTFGPATRAAVAKYQAAMGISPAAGYVGPMTRTSLNAKLAAGGTTTTGTFPAGCTSASGFSSTTGMPCTTSSTLPAGCTSTAGFSPVTGVSCSGSGSTPSAGLSGGAGSVSDYTIMASLVNEEVGEGEEDVQVAGLEIEADGGSDIELTAVKLVFANDDTSGSSATADDDFDEYVREVSIWFNGEEVARVDGSEFTDDNLWSQTITLDDGAIIRAGDTENLIAAVSGVSNLDSTFAAESWDVDFRSVRFVDAQGASNSEDPVTAVKLFSFETFATAAGSELKIATNDEAINDAHILDVHATDESASQDVELLSFTLEAEGDSDLEIRKFGIDVDVTGAANVDDVIVGGAAPAIKLMIEGEEYGTATYGGNGGAAYSAGTTGVGQSESIRFEEVNYTIPAGETVEVLIVADLLAVDTALDEGDTITVTLGETETDQVTFNQIRDEAGENLVDADITGTASAGAHGIFDVYIDVALVSQSTVVLPDDDADDNDIATFTMVFDITARGGSVYVGDTSIATAVANGSVGISVTDAIVYRVYDSGTATTDDLADLITFTTPNGVTDSTDNILITDGHTSRVTMTVTQTNNDASDDGIYYLDLAAIGWGIADDTTYEFTYVYGLEDFKTTAVSIN